MKTIALTLIAGIAAASSAFAGHEISHKDKVVTPMEPCFKDQELQLDVFGSYTATRNGSSHGDGFGGGLGVNYFFMKYVGVGVDGNIYDGDANGVWDFSARVIVRYPIEMGSFCIAPYAFGGGGLVTDGGTDGTLHAGGGLEWRATHTIGIFGEGRYTWADTSSNDNAQARVGVRFVF